MLKWKSIAILLIILVSLLPLYWMYGILQRRMRPRDSLRRFAGWVIAVLALIFVYTFLLVLLIKLIFPGA